MYIQTTLGKHKIKQQKKKNMLFNSFKDHLVVVHSRPWAPTMPSV